MPSGAISNRPSWPKSLAQLPLTKQVIGILWFSLYSVTTLALYSFDPADLNFNVYPANPVPTNFIGKVGAGVAGILYIGFGLGAWLFPLLFIWACLVNLRGTQIDWRWKSLWIALFVISGCCLLDLQHLGGWQFIRTHANIDSPGGLIGGQIIQLAVPIGSVGAYFLFGTMFVASAIFLFNVNPITTVFGAFSWYRDWTARREEERLANAPMEEKLDREWRLKQQQIEELQRKAAWEAEQQAVVDRLPEESAPVSRILRPDDEPELEEPVAPPEPEPPPAKPARTLRSAAKAAPLLPTDPVPNPDYMLPSLQLLSAPPGRARDVGLSEDQLKKNLATIVETLRLFGVSATPGDITPGATITRYEVYPAAGVRVDKISGLGKDLSRVLCAERINILAPIPGRDSVGIEIPNSNKVSVYLRELLESRDWLNTTAKIPIALGKDVYGKTLVADLAAMPHLLIGGTTGSGKSVCINCILLSFLFRFSPEDLRLILIDPKQVEMQVYNAIPHLVVPVVTDPKKVMLALRWVINEMENRYRILAKVGVRNIASFNSRTRTEAAPAPDEPQLQLSAVLPDVEEEEEDEEPAQKSLPLRVPREDDLFIPDKLPYIVVIVDELADLMQSAPADVESAVARLTAKARAAGIHLIVATQTPRREVVTGVIKTNIPARIAFQVPSGLDSRVILDENGAENLLGRGDLFYRPPGVGRLTRGQGAFVSDEEVSSVVKFVGDQAEAQFVPEIHNKLSGKVPEGMELSDEDRDLIIEAWDLIRHGERASTSNIQRRMRLGYNRAAYIIDFLEKIGVLAPGEGAKPREILVDIESYELNF